jgi:DNA repair protein RecO (recombination protein O)
MTGFHDEAVVLKKYDFGEAGRILTLFTKGHGKIKVLARGVRRPTSRKGGNLDLLNHVGVFINKGRNLDIVTQAQATKTFSDLKMDIGSISKAYYICEITDALCAEGVISNYIFDNLVATFSNFLTNTTKRIWDYEFNLLNHLGFIDESKKGAKGLRSYVEEIIERELKAPKFYHSVLGVERGRLVFDNQKNI